MKSKRPKPASASSGPNTEASRRPVWRFRLLALAGVTLVFFLLLEGVLRLLGLGYPVEFFVPAPTGSKGVMVENREFSRRYFSRPLMRVPQTTALSREKQPGTTRIFVFGESAAEGDPAPSFGLARMLEVLLEDRFPGRRFELINTSVTAINSHVIRPIALECAALQGDIWVVYMGNNEVVGPFGSGTIFGPQAPPLPLIRGNLWVKSTRIGQVMDDLMQRAAAGQRPESWGGMEMFLGQQVALTDPRTESVYAHFRSNLDAILDAGVSSGAKVVVATVGSNLRDCPPFASLNRGELDAEQRAEWDRLFQAGVQAEAGRLLEQAIGKFEEALKIDDQHAELNFRLARCLAAAGRPHEAARHFTRARDLDTLRFRCDSRLNEIIREVTADSSRKGVRLADVEAALRAAAPDGVPGRESFHEHVHLTESGNYRAAVAIARQVIGLLEPAAADASEAGLLAEGECVARLGLTDHERAQMLAEMANRTSRPPFVGQLDHAAEMARREEHLRELRERARVGGATNLAIHLAAVKRNPDDWRLHDNLAGAFLQSGQRDRAAEHWREVIRLVPHRVQSYDLVGSVLLEAGRPAEAVSLYEQALGIRPEWIEGLVGLGRCRAALGKLPEAMELFQKAIRLAGRDATPRNHLGVALLQAGRAGEAVAAFRDAIRTDPGFVAARLNFGKALLADGKPGDGVAVFRELVREFPGDTAARVELVRALNRLGQPDEALQEAQAAASAHPRSFEVRQSLANLLIRQQRFDEAAAEFAAALALNPESAESHLNLGTLRARQGQPDQARLHFEQAVRIDPGLVPARLNAAAACLDLGLIEPATVHLREALRIEPGNARARALLNDAETRRGGR